MTLSATDAAGNSAAVSRTVSVAGHLKPAQFTLSFTDLELPATGIPITVSRTYSTLRAGEALDFGYGWNLDLSRPRVQIVLFPKILA